MKRLMLFVMLAFAASAAFAQYCPQCGTPQGPPLPTTHCHQVCHYNPTTGQTICDTTCN